MNIFSSYIIFHEFFTLWFFTDGINHGKQSRFITYLVLFFDMIELSYYIISTIHWLLVMLFPCQPGLLSSILCSSNNGLENYIIAKWFIAALEFLIFMQSAIGAGYYTTTVFLTGVTYLLIECGNFVKLHKTGVAHQIEYRVQKGANYRKIIKCLYTQADFLGGCPHYTHVSDDNILPGD